MLARVLHAHTHTRARAELVPTRAQAGVAGTQGLRCSERWQALHVGGSGGACRLPPAIRLARVIIRHGAGDSAAQRCTRDGHGLHARTHLRGPRALPSSPPSCSPSAPAGSCTSWQSAWQAAEHCRAHAPFTQRQGQSVCLRGPNAHTHAAFSHIRALPDAQAS